MKLKTFIVLGIFLVLLSISVLSLIVIYSVNVNQYTVISLFILGWVGFILFVISSFRWSLTLPQKIKRIVLIIFGVLVFLLTLPLTSYCPELPHDNDPRTMENDIAVCRTVFPYESYYWAKVSEEILGHDKEEPYYLHNDFYFFGGFHLISEKYELFLENKRMAVKKSRKTLDSASVAIDEEPEQVVEKIQVKESISTTSVPDPEPSKLPKATTEDKDFIHVFTVSSYEVLPSPDSHKLRVEIHPWKWDPQETRTLSGTIIVNTKLDPAELKKSKSAMFTFYVKCNPETNEYDLIKHYWAIYD